MKEVGIQKSIIDLVTEAGGFSFKLSNQFLSGVPDLFIALPGICPVLAEVKNLGGITPTTYRKIELTPLQKLKLGKINAVASIANSKLAVVIVTFEHNGEKYGFVTDETTTHFNARDFIRLGPSHPSYFIRRKGKFDLGRCLRNLGVRSIGSDQQ